MAEKIFQFFLIGLGVVIFFIPSSTSAKTVIKKGQHITVNTTWTAENSPYIVEDFVSIFTGVKLSIQPGVVVKMREAGTIYSRGVGTELEIKGSAEEPVIFTSIYDDTVGGDQSPVPDKTPIPGIWGDIGVDSGGKLNIDNAIFKYGGVDPGWVGGLSVGVIFVWDGKVNITNSVFTQNIRAIFNYWNYGGSVTIHDSKIFGNSQGGIYNNSTRFIDATNNWWGDESGPYEVSGNPLGRGDKIGYIYSQNRVAYDPWIGKHSNQSPVLSYSQEEEYRASSSLGVNPSKGDAGLTDFVFKLVYADEDNDAPTDVAVVIQDEYASSSLSMSIDSGENVNITLRDGNYIDGEQFFLSKKFIQGKYKYYFVATNAKHSVRWPKTGELEFEAGFSNIIFLPGLEASRLYKQDDWFENQLWEPNRNGDVEKLFLDGDGKSVDPGIYTRDVVDEICNFSFCSNIYKTFLKSLDELMTNKTINKYKALSYDWRMGINEIVTGNTKTDNGTYSMLGEVIFAAESSQTGKVTIIAHSMGGLVAKRLIQKLTEMERQDVVDKLILVASPQTGTPGAVAALLHGDKQELLGGLLLDKTTARGLAENMKGAYSLVPASGYFADAEIPVISFEGLSSNASNDMIGYYGAEISSSATLYQYLQGADGRVKPAANDVSASNVLARSFIDESIGLHNSIDAWVPPAGLKVYQIVGWGLDTIAGIKYKEKQSVECPEYATDMQYCNVRTYYDHEPVFSINGDKTVMVSSAIAMKDAWTYYVDLVKYNNEVFNVSRNHSDLLEVDSVQKLIHDMSVNNLLDTPIYMSSSMPGSEEARLRISVHSPVSLGIYDSAGRHTGKIKNPDSDSDLQLIERQIPNSYYMDFGEGKYVGVGSSDHVQLDLKGLDYGAFTLDITEVSNGSEKTISYHDIPVTPTTVAKLLLSSLADMSALTIDLNGDGKTDLNIAAAEDSIDPVQYIEMIEQYILNANLDKHVQTELLVKFKNLKKFITKDKKHEVQEVKKIEDWFGLIEKHVFKLSAASLNRQQVEILLSMLNNLRKLIIK